MSCEALVRFLVLGVLCYTLVLAVQEEKKHVDVGISDEKQTAKQTTKNLQDDSEKGPEEKTSHPNCSPAPQCPEGFGLLKSEEFNSDGCPLYQCIHPLPQTRGALPVTPAIRQVGSQCAVPKCGVGYKSRARVFPKPLVGCPMYFCEPANASIKKAWNKCRVTANSMETFDGKGLPCVKPCDVILVKDAFGFWSVRLSKYCRYGGCSSRLKVFLKHGNLLGGNQYNLTINSDLSIKVRYHYPKKSGRIVFSASEARLIGKQFPFGATVSGDTMVFNSGGWGVRIIWNTLSEGSVRVKYNLLWQVYGACNFYAGMGPYGGKGGQKAKTTAQHIKSWSPPRKRGGCKTPRCNKAAETKAWQICEKIRDKPFNKCKNVMDTCNYPAKCKETVCQCLQSGKPKSVCKCNALKSFTKDCLAAKSSLQPLLQEGLEAKGCDKRCPEGMTYVWCRKKTCEKDCLSLLGKKCSKISGVCTSGCFCPAGMVKKGKKCVTKRECRTCKCSGSTDGSHQTLDGQSFKFKGSCTYVALRDRNNNMRVYVTYLNCYDKDKNTLCTLILRVRAIGGRDIVIRKSEDSVDVKLGRRHIDLPYKGKLIRIQRIQEGVQLFIKEIGLEISVSQDLDYPEIQTFKINIPPVLYKVSRNPTEGVCGVCTGPGSKGTTLRLKTRSRGLTSVIQKYIKSWRAALTSSYYKKEKHCKTGPIKPVCKNTNEFEKKICSTLDRLKRSSFRNCDLDPSGFKQKCRELICTVNTPEEKRKIGCKVIAEYAAKCCENGRRIRRWRRTAKCPPVPCKGGQRYRVCGPGCFKACDNPKCPKQTRRSEGCYCRRGKLWNGVRCVNKRKCKTCDGHYIGDKWTDYVKCWRCHCKGLKKTVCSRLCSKKMKKCRWDQRILVTKRGCCKKCVCRRPCPRQSKPRCKKGEVIATTLSKCGCPKYSCHCKAWTCPPKPTCDKSQQLNSYNKKGHCCPIHKCICLGARYCKPVKVPNCRRDQSPKTVYDKVGCCVTGYKCVCNRCRHSWIPRCRRDQRRKPTRTECKCIKYKCVCRKCGPRPVCGRYSDLFSYKVKNKCCPVNYCKCNRKRCPHVKPDLTKCKGDQIIKEKWDPSRCCVEKYTCKCDKCKRPRKPRCSRNEKIKIVRTFCKCPMYKCVCNNSTCRPLPKCSRYEIRRAIVSDEKSSCCDLYECICAGLKKCPKVKHPPCHKYMRVKVTTDHKGCCVIRKECVCDKSKCKPLPRCGWKQTLVKRRSYCGCTEGKCVCDRTKCKRKRCRRYQQSVTLSRRGCCPKQRCDCIPSDRCPRVKLDTTKCTREQKLQPRYDPARCCLTHYSCVCKPCKNVTSKTCGKYETETFKFTPCRCARFGCKCDVSKCPKRPSCSRYATLVGYYKKRNSCCKKYSCKCIQKRCPVIRTVPKCTDEQVRKRVKDKSKCCVTNYICKCPVPLICPLVSFKRCGLGENMEYVKTACGCPKVVCVCNKRKVCPPKPTCGKYQLLRVLPVSTNCCKAFECACIGLQNCPRVKGPKCKDEQVQKEIYDRNGCCVKKKICVCSKCPSIRAPNCKRHYKIQSKKTTCCNYAKCVCDKASCPKKKCTKYQRTVSLVVPGSCCPFTGCTCDFRKCPKQRVFSHQDCKKGQVLLSKLTKDGCCRLFSCKCTRCRIANLPDCKRNQKIIRKVTPCGCTKFRCVCDKKRCPRPPKCGEFEKRVKIKYRRSCCPKYVCVCDRRRCKPIKINKKLCTDEQKLVPMMDAKKCCIVGYTCKCDKCKKQPLPRCKNFEKVSTFKSSCECDKYVCKCNDTIPCKPVPICSKYQKMVISSMSNTCCKRFECVCKGASFCPEIVTPKCKDEQIIKATHDRENCCEIKRECICPAGMCGLPKVPRCGRYQKVKRIETKCCTKFKCICASEKCPLKLCGTYQTLESRVLPGRCCPWTRCRCDPGKCPRPPQPKNCPKGKKLVVKQDKYKCCLLKYTCFCRRCKPWKPANCRTDQRTKFRRTLCGCIKAVCVCDRRTCAPKKDCGPYRTLKTRKYRNACCARYSCKCDTAKCPRNLRSPSCSVEEKSVPIYDKYKCCVVANTCECKWPCKKYRRPACKSFEVVKYHNSKCGCTTPECVCSNVTKCEPVPRCSKEEELVKSGRSTKCCKRYICACKGQRFCKRIKTPKCTKEQKVVEVVGKCCIEKKYCKCKKCPPVKVPICDKYKALRLKPTTCCQKFVCKCVPGRCPIKNCPKNHVKIEYREEGKCCPTVQCICKQKTCPKKPSDLKCKGDQVVKEKLDENECCANFKCGCRRCKPPKPVRCRVDQKIKETKTICGCSKYSCVCDKDKCKAKPLCPRNTKLKVTQEAKKCCPTYECRCINRQRCPKRKVNPKMCKDEETLVPVYDANKCCIERWKCICGVCQAFATPPCAKYQKVIFENSRCNCPKPKCVCNDNTECKPKPKCGKFQILTTSNSSDPCCLRYKCVCRGITFCPTVKDVRCRDEEVLKVSNDADDCCIVKKRCVCPPKCPTVPTPQCKKGERVVKKPSACCLTKKCACDKSKCEKKKCDKCMKAVPVAVKGQCCPKYICVCNTKCCKAATIDASRCKDEERLQPVYDKNHCCIKRYKCVCSKCNIVHKPICGWKRKVLERESRCGCKTYKCVCNHSKCNAPPTCEIYEKLKQTRRAGACCAEYYCVCDKRTCPPRPGRPNCRDEQKIVSVTDPKGCCLIKYKCVCPRKCPKRNYPPCDLYEKLLFKKSACKCNKPRCVCNHIKCPVIPNCSEYQTLKTYATTKCCKHHRCQCIKLSKCPRVRTPKCKDEQYVKESFDKDGCCIVRKVCKCPETCPKTANVSCAANKTAVAVSTRCCSKFKCVCDISKCPDRPKCEKLETLKRYKVTGKCCPVYECLPPKGCVVMDKKTREYILKKKKATWKENKCRKCQCKMPAGGYEAHCVTKVCKKCGPGFKLVKRKGKCCGRCIQQKCVMGKGKKKFVFKVGQSWKDHCSKYICKKTKNTYGLKVSKIPCKQAPFCKKGQKPKTDNCGCKDCKKPSCKPKKVHPRATLGLVRLEVTPGYVCVNKRKIYGYIKCDGVCKPLALNLNEKRDVLTKCRSVKTKKVGVELTCPDGKTILQETKVPISCKCTKTCVCDKP